MKEQENALIVNRNICPWQLPDRIIGVFVLLEYFKHVKRPVGCIFLSLEAIQHIHVYYSLIILYLGKSTPYKVVKTCFNLFPYNISNIDTRHYPNGQKNLGKTTTQVFNLFTNIQSIFITWSIKLYHLSFYILRIFISLFKYSFHLCGHLYL